MADIKGIRGKASWRCLSNRMSAEVNVFSVVNSINIKPEKSVINIVKAQTIVWDNLHEKPGFGIKIYRSIVTVYWIPISAKWMTAKMFRTREVQRFNLLRMVSWIFKYFIWIIWKLVYSLYFWQQYFLS